jgi:RHS repeat-associated protein
MTHFTRAVFLALLMVLLALPARAQCNPSYDPDCLGGGDARGPDIGFNPDGGTYTIPAGTSQTIAVTATFSDADGLLQQTLQLKLWHNGTSRPLTGFTWTANSNGTFARAKGSITIGILGEHVLTAEISDRAGAVSSRRASFWLTSPDPNKPVVSTAPHHGHYRMTSLGASILGYSLPAYVSMGSGKAFGLSYNSQHADPTGFVQLDVDTGSDASGSLVKAVTLQIVDQATNAAVTSEDAWTKHPSGKQRVGAQWSMRDRPTGAYLFWADVRGYRADKTTHTLTRVPIRVLVINERLSRYGVGWSVAGVQRLHPDAAGVMVNEGNGVARYFEKQGSDYRTPDGDFSRITYDATTGGYFRTYIDGTKVTFNSEGIMTKVTDRFGRNSIFTWAKVDQPAVWILTQVTDAANKITWTEWYDGYLKSVVDPAGRRVDLTYSAGNLVRFTGPTTLDVSYDASNRATSYTDWNGTWDIAYDARGAVQRLTGPAVTASGASVRPATTYQSLQSLTTLTSWATHICCNWAAPVPTDVMTSATDPLGHTVRTALNAYGQVTKLVDLTAHTITTTYDDHGLPLTTSDSYQATTHSWNDRGQLLSKSVNGVVVYHASYGAGDQPEFVMSGGAGQWFTYGSRGEVLQSWPGRKEDAYKNATTYQYDTSYRIIATIGPKGERTEFSYDTNWQNVSEVRVRREDGTMLTTSTTYDTAGRAASVTDSLNNTVTTSYDLLNRVIKVVYPQQRIEKFAYTGPFLTSVTDRVGKVHRYNYNALGWLVSEVFPDGKTRSYRYDADGLEIGNTDRRGLTVTHKYDAAHRMTERVADGITTTYAYPDLFTAVASNGEATETIRLHQENGMVQTVKTSIGGPASSNAYEVEKLYDRNAGWRFMGLDVRRLQGSTTVKTDSIRYTPDYFPTDPAYGATMAVQDMTGRTTTVAVDPSGRQFKTVFPNGISQFNYFGDDGRLIGTSFSPGPVDYAFGAGYTYDLLNRLSTRASSDGKKRWTYGYDTFGQLTEYQTAELRPMTNCNPSYETCDEMWETTRIASYTYDAAGNRTDLGATVEPSSNRYSSFNGFALQYDAEGNITRKAKGTFVQTLAWNSLNQLTSVTTNGVTVMYGYSPTGWRIRRTQNGQSLYSVYGNSDLLMEVDAYANPIRAYTHLPGVDRPLSVRINNGGVDSTYYYTQEQPGHVTGLMNINGGVAAQHRYGPFGEAETTSDPTGQPLRYMGRELDASTGLYYVRARWYDTALGRFVSEDPIGLAGGMNTYAYVGNDPVNRRDPSGLQPGDDPECPFCLPPIVIECAMLRYDPRCDDGNWWEQGIFASWARQRAKDEYDMWKPHYVPVPSSREHCTFGGNLPTDAEWRRCMRANFERDQAVAHNYREWDRIHDLCVGMEDNPGFFEDLVANAEWGTIKALAVALLLRRGGFSRLQAGAGGTALAVGESAVETPVERAGTSYRRYAQCQGFTWH